MIDIKSQSFLFLCIDLLFKVGYNIIEEKEKGGFKYGKEIFRISI